MSLAMQMSLISRTQLSSMARKPGPLSPLAITQSMPVMSMAANDPSNGSHDRNFTTVAVSRNRSIRHAKAWICDANDRASFRWASAVGHPPTAISLKRKFFPQVTS